VEITLQAGDALVIPPFWFHEVQTHSASLAVSLWWDAAELDGMDRVYALPLPFEIQWDEATLVHRAGCFVSALIESTVAMVEFELQERSYENVRALFSAAEVIRLLEIRYSDDLRYHKTAERVHGVNKADDLSTDCAAVQRMDRAMQRHAAVFSTEFLRRENFVTTDALPAFHHRTVADAQKATEPCTVGGAAEGNTCATATASQYAREEVVLGNQLAVLTIKLCDYIEDVFRHVSEMLAEKDASGAVGGRNARGRSINSIAVALLVDWLISARK
jgi:hypothetical protein